MEVVLTSRMLNHLDLNFVPQNPSVDSSSEINFLCDLFMDLCITSDDLNIGLAKHHSSSSLYLTEFQEIYNCFPVTGSNISGDLVQCQICGGSPIVNSGSGQSQVPDSVNIRSGQNILMGQVNTRTGQNNWMLNLIAGEANNAS